MFFILKHFLAQFEHKCELYKSNNEKHNSMITLIKTFALADSALFVEFIG